MQILKIAAVLAVVLLAFPQTVLGATSEFDRQMVEIYKHYQAMHASLAGDSDAGVTQGAVAIQGLANKLDVSQASAEHADHYKELPAKLTKAAENVAKAKGIDAQRQAFKGLSKPMAMWASMSPEAGVNVVYCSMAEGSWLQKEAAVKNPYYGSKMLACGDIVSGPAKGDSGSDSGHDMHQH